MIRQHSEEFFKYKYAAVFNLPDMGIVLQTHQSVLRIIEDTLLDAQFCPRGAANGGLSGGPVLQRETRTNVTNRDSVDFS